MKIEKYDQYLLLPVLFIALIILWGKLEITYYIFAGFILGLLGLALFNKGRKSTVNLSTDISYIAFAFVLLCVAIYYLAFVQIDYWILALAAILVIIIAALYR